MTTMRRAAGFTLVEMMIATLIFSMVIAGFAAIYTTAFSQSGAVLRDARLKSVTIVSIKNITQMMASATRVYQPNPGSSGNAFAGCLRMAPDGDPLDLPPPPLGEPGAFGFCIQPSASNGCGRVVNGEVENPPPCLFMYTWTSCPLPALDSGNCGQALGSMEVVELASRVLVPGPLEPTDTCSTTTSFYPASPNYFTRGGNDVRIATRLCRPQGGKVPKMWFDSSTVAYGHFDSRL